MPARSTPESFWKRVDRKDPQECWSFKGCLAHGYGLLRYRGDSWQAHRLAYVLAIGPIPIDHDVCHSCDNPACCNPAHLWSGTAKDNGLDAARKGRMRRHYSVEEIQKVKELLAQGLNTYEVARRLNIGRRAVRRVHDGQTWTWLQRKS